MRKRRRGRTVGSHCDGKVGLSKSSSRANETDGTLFDILNSAGERAEPSSGIPSLSPPLEE